MIVKGIVSAIQADKNTVEVILPEYNGIVTDALRIYRDKSVESLKVNDFVLVVFFNDDFNDGLVLI